MSIYKKWDYLKAGDVVDIIATTPGIGIKNLKEDLLFGLKKYFNQFSANKNSLNKLPIL